MNHSGMTPILISRQRNPTSVTRIKGCVHQTAATGKGICVYIELLYLIIWEKEAFLLHIYFYLKFLTQRISPTSVLGQVRWMLAVVHYYKLKWRFVALKSSARRCHSVSIPLPVNSKRLHLKHAVGKGLADYPSLSLKVCCTVSRSLYPLLPKRICPKWTTTAISLGQSAHGAPSSFVPGRRGLSHGDFVRVATRPEWG